MLRCLSALSCVKRVESILRSSWVLLAAPDTGSYMCFTFSCGWLIAGCRLLFGFSRQQVGGRRRVCAPGDAHSPLPCPIQDPLQCLRAISERDRSRSEERVSLPFLSFFFSPYCVAQGGELCPPQGSSLRWVCLSSAAAELGDGAACPPLRWRCGGRRCCCRLSPRRRVRLCAVPGDMSRTSPWLVWFVCFRGNKAPLLQTARTRARG